MSQVNQDHLDLLELLRRSRDPLSGEVLAADLGISRVALWKRIQVLRHRGYQIRGTPQGYVLAGEDVLESWEFPRDFGPVHYLDRTTSTMDQAWTLVRQGAGAGTLVLAGQQSQGRDHAGASWPSDPGNLFMTLILEPQIPQRFLGSLVIQALSMVCGILAEPSEGRLRWRWPQDLVLGEVKVGGILAEAQVSQGRLERVLLGLGLQVKAHPDLEGLPRRPFVVDFCQGLLEGLKPGLEAGLPPGGLRGPWEAKDAQGSYYTGETLDLLPTGDLRDAQGRVLFWGDPLLEFLQRG